MSKVWIFLSILCTLLLPTGGGQLSFSLIGVPSALMAKHEYDLANVPEPTPEPEPEPEIPNYHVGIPSKIDIPGYCTLSIPTSHLKEMDGSTNNKKTFSYKDTQSRVEIEYGLNVSDEILSDLPNSIIKTAEYETDERVYGDVSYDVVTGTQSDGYRKTIWYKRKGASLLQITFYAAEMSELVQDEVDEVMEFLLSTLNVYYVDGPLFDTPSVGYWENIEEPSGDDASGEVEPGEDGEEQDGEETSEGDSGEAGETEEAGESSEAVEDGEETSSEAPDGETEEASDTDSEASDGTEASANSGDNVMSPEYRRQHRFEEDSGISNNWEDMQFKLADDLIKLPCKVLDLESLGYMTYSGKKSLGAGIGTMEFMRRADGLRLQVDMRNNEDKEQELSYCDVEGIKVDVSSFGIRSDEGLDISSSTKAYTSDELPYFACMGGISWNTDVDAIVEYLKQYGEVYRTQNKDKTYTISIKSKDKTKEMSIRMSLMQVEQFYIHFIHQ